jgi:hypothetical protein
VADREHRQKQKEGKKIKVVDESGVHEETIKVVDVDDEEIEFQRAKRAFLEKGQKRLEKRGKDNRSWKWFRRKEDESSDRDDDFVAVENQGCFRNCFWNKRKRSGLSVALKEMPTEEAWKKKQFDSTNEHLIKGESYLVCICRDPAVFLTFCIFKWFLYHFLLLNEMFHLYYD